MSEIEVEWTFDNCKNWKCGYNAMLKNCHERLKIDPKIGILKLFYTDRHELTIDSWMIDNENDFWEACVEPKFSWSEKRHFLFKA